MCRSADCGVDQGSEAARHARFDDGGLGSEFGRTPLEKIVLPRGDTGRDHHPFAYTMLLAGGGLKGGRPTSKTDEIGWGIEENPVHINDLRDNVASIRFGSLKAHLPISGRDFRLTDVGGNVMRVGLRNHLGLVLGEDSEFGF